MKHKGLWIPAVLLDDIRLTLAEQFILANIFALAAKDGCYAKNAYIANLCNCTAETVSRTISKGRKLGYLTVTNSDTYERTIKVSGQAVSEESIPLDEEINPPLRGESTPDRNVPNNYNNKTYHYTRNVTARTGANTPPAEREKKKYSGEEKTLPSSFDPEEFFAAALARTERMFKEQGFTDDPNEPLPWQVEAENNANANA